LNIWEKTLAVKAEHDYPEWLPYVPVSFYELVILGFMGIVCVYPVDYIEDEYGCVEAELL